MSKPEHLDKKKTIEIDECHKIYYRDFEALILTPSLGYPAVLHQKDDKTSEQDLWLEFMILGEAEDLNPSDVAFHMRYSHWDDKNQTTSYYTRLNLWDEFAAKVLTQEEFGNMITISKPVANNSNSFGSGAVKNDNIYGKHEFKLKCAHSILFERFQDEFSTFQYVYKVAVNLKYENVFPENMYNLRWLNKQDDTITKGKPVWFNSDDVRRTVLKGKEFKHELEEYGGVDPATSMIKPDKHINNFQAYLYHPFYVSKKNKLNIGHVTDIHMDSRMDLYAQSEASVIEVDENCPPEFDDIERTVNNKTFHNPIKKMIASFNNVFTDVSEQIFFEGADILIVTGDLVDYNRGIHTAQTHKKEAVKISKVWDDLDSDAAYQKDRNWFTFYERLLDLYDTQKKPIFTMLGNHEAVKHGMAPWPLWGALWNGVFDQNLTLYESGICYGPGYKSDKEFIYDLKESYEYVEWYMFFINPFSDFVVEYGDQSIYIVDWGDGSSVIPPGVTSKITNPLANILSMPIRTIFPASEKSLFRESVGPLHHSKNVLKDKNYDIYKSWLAAAKAKSKISMLFMHATTICPRDDISIGEIDNNFKWSDNPLKYGAFDGNRKQVIQDVENGDLKITVGGHSHRNIIMNVTEDNPFKAKVIGSGTTFGTITTKPENLVIVTSSCGPFPKYIPGGPLICGCTGDKDKYDTGWDYQGDTIYGLFGDGKFYGYHHNKDKNGNESHLATRYEMSPPECPDCRMHAKDMERKITKRHRPGGNLLKFTADDQVQIRSVFTNEGMDARVAVMSDENKFFTQKMKLEDIDSEEDYYYWKKNDLLKVISKAPFKLYGSLVFPDKVQYVTFKEKGLRGKDSLDVKVKDYKVDKYSKKIKKFKEYNKSVRQSIGKQNFKKFMLAGLSRSDFAFMRYTYLSTQEKWDREVKIYKDPFVEYAENEEQQTTFNQRSIDPFRGLLIKFLRKSDSEKRKKICGY